MSEPRRRNIVTDLPRLPRREADSNKGTYGKVLVVAGSVGMSGAAVLCGRSALRGGAGLVRVAVPRSILPVVAAAEPCYTTVPLAEDEQGRLALPARDDLLAQAGLNDVIAAGPGLGRSGELTELLRGLLRGSQVPVVLDADGLNAFQGQAHYLKERGCPLVITPHPGEFARLTGKGIPAVQQHREELAAEFAAAHGLVVALKGHGTVVTDGDRLYTNRTGNAGMATGGTGDVLTGLVAALLGQGLEPFAAAQLGVYLHGLAGDLAAGEVGEVGMIATDVIAALPAALRRL